MAGRLMQPFLPVMELFHVRTRFMCASHTTSVLRCSKTISVHATVSRIRFMTASGGFTRPVHTSCCRTFYARFFDDHARFVPVGPPFLDDLFMTVSGSFYGQRTPLYEHFTSVSRFSYTRLTSVSRPSKVIAASCSRFMTVSHNGFTYPFHVTVSRNPFTKPFHVSVSRIRFT